MEKNPTMIEPIETVVDNKLINLEENTVITIEPGKFINVVARNS